MVIHHLRARSFQLNVPEKIDSRQRRHLSDVQRSSPVKTSKSSDERDSVCIEAQRRASLVAGPMDDKNCRQEQQSFLSRKAATCPDLHKSKKRSVHKSRQRRHTDTDLNENLANTSLRPLIDGPRLVPDRKTIEWIYSVFSSLQTVIPGLNKEPYQSFLKILSNYVGANGALSTTFGSASEDVRQMEKFLKHLDIGSLLVLIETQKDFERLRKKHFSANHSADVYETMKRLHMILNLS